MAEVTGEVSAKGIKFDQVPYSSQLPRGSGERRHLPDKQCH